MVIVRVLGVCLFVILIACSSENQSAQVNFIPTLAQKSFNCHSVHQSDKSAWQFSQVQFFVSEFALQDLDGHWQSLKMRDTAYQTEGVALLGVHCSEPNAANWQVEFSQAIDLSLYQNMRFSVGIPFEQNHKNPLTQKSPLNDSSMFWVWQTGHKFLRLEMSNSNENWLYHLGSTGCKSPSVMRSPQQACLYPNTVPIELALPETTPSSVDVLVNLSALMNEITLNEKTRCQSEVDNATCQQLLNNLANNGNTLMFKVNNAL
ncbi:MbnP family copper-binding protein [Colwelliaceae bacterium 6441]